MTIDHPDRPNVMPSDPPVQWSTTNHLPFSSSAAGDEDSNINYLESMNGQSLDVRGLSSRQSMDYVRESPPPVPPRPPETMNSDSSSPDSPLEVWPPFQEAESIRRNMGRQASCQMLRSDMKEVKKLKRFSTSICAGELVPIQPHPPLRSCKSEAEQSSSPTESTKISRALSDGAMNRIKRSISSIFRRKMSSSKLDHESASMDVASTEKVAEERRERLRYALFPNSGEIQFAKNDEPPPPLPPRNWQQEQKTSLPPRNLKKSRRTYAKQGWSNLSSKEVTRNALDS